MPRVRCFESLPVDQLEVRVLEGQKKVPKCDYCRDITPRMLEMTCGHLLCQHCFAAPPDNAAFCPLCGLSTRREATLLLHDSLLYNVRVQCSCLSTMLVRELVDHQQHCEAMMRQLQQQQRGGRNNTNATPPPSAPLLRSILTPTMLPPLGPPPRFAPLPPLASFSLPLQRPPPLPTTADLLRMQSNHQQQPAAAAVRLPSYNKQGASSMLKHNMFV